jgi:hypothetical protein
VKQVRVDSIWQLDGPHWGQATPRDLAEHVRLVNEADVAYPIILAADGRVMDGMHRVVKALIQHRETIPAVQFEIQPEPDYSNDRWRRLLFWTAALVLVGLFCLGVARDGQGLRLFASTSLLGRSLSASSRVGDGDERRSSSARQLGALVETCDTLVHVGSSCW